MGDFLMKLVPWYYRWAAIGVALVVAAITGAAQMHSYMQDKVDLLEAEAARDKAVGAALAAKQELEFVQNAADTKKGHQHEVDAIHAYYAADPVVVHVPADQGTQPGPGCPDRTDGPAAEPMAAGPDRGFEKACALDAAQVNAWRDWCTRNHCKVE